MKFKEYGVYIMMLLIVGASVWNEIREDHDHHAFFEDVRAFMNKGGRNTAAHGYELCNRINDLQEVQSELNGYDFVSLNCEEIYGVKK